jgi:two-component sensor histidine kinase
MRSRVHPDDLKRAEQEHSAARARGGPWSVQYRVIDPDGEVRWVSAYAQFSRRGDGVYSTGIAVDITEQKRLEERQSLLLAELNHRVKNMLAVVQSIAAQTFTGDDLEAQRRQSFDSRLLALASVHDLLQQDSWQPVGMQKLVNQAIGPFERRDSGQFDVDGPDTELPTSRCVALSLALHELCTNAVKYGALSREAGRVMIRWSVQDGQLDFAWRESGGPRTSAPASSGFGSRMLQKGLARELGTAVILDFDPDGLRCSFSAPL